MVSLMNGRAQFVIGFGYDVAASMLYRGFVLAQLPSGKWEIEDMLGACCGVVESIREAQRAVDTFWE